ncbi:MAG: hypothetical protein ACI89X_001953 [Planctomycetota bacterium]|jgi:hypothetical protein
MYPHERSLVQDLKDKPFALLGINSDPKLEQIKQIVAAKRLTWRSFWNGPKGTRGPISTRWNIEGWPTVYVIDHKGVIRHKNVQGEALDEAIHVLLTEAESR